VNHTPLKKLLLKPREFVGNNGSYQVIETEDQSVTLKSLAFDEACHSLSGAYAETLHNYYIPCQIELRAQTQPRLTILEVGFGLGVGVQATFQSLQKHFAQIGQIHYISLELDEALVEFSKEYTQIEAEDFPSLKDLEKSQDHGLTLYQAQKNKNRLSVIVGDARQTLLQAFRERLFCPVDAIYQDAFSPRKNPELWTQEWFEDLIKVSHSQTLMTTYCASLSPRKAMSAAGYQLSSFKGLGKKRECTIASLSGSTDSVIAAQLEKSQAPILRDEIIDSYRQK
jgi:tRNA U34 5-methylaminomethyl-2-thiouridine-forming methyltransferase MnmC